MYRTLETRNVTQPVTYLSRIKILLNTEYTHFFFLILWGESTLYY
jgi:hypothetical protein